MSLFLNDDCFTIDILNYYERYFQGCSGKSQYAIVYNLMLGREVAKSEKRIIGEF